MSQAVRAFMFGLLSVAVVTFAFAGGYATAVYLYPPPAAAAVTQPAVAGGLPEAAASTTPNELREQFKVFWEAWRVVQEHFIDRKNLNVKKMTYGAIKGVVDSLGDSHSWHLDPETYRIERSDLSATFSGIGATVAIENKQLVVVAPLDETPAQRAGLQPGTRILAVDGDDTSRMTLSEAVARIRGPRGTSVRLTVILPGETKPTVVEVVRDNIKLESVKWKMLPDGMVYLRITQFTDRTSAEINQALRDLRRFSPTALVVDVRRNPGGLLNSVVQVTSQFLKEGVILYQVDGDGKRQPYSVQAGGQATDIKMVILVDKGSASASEILAGALQDTGRAALIGEETFGKGSVQQIYELSDGSAVYVTIARWLTPKGNLIEGKGIVPDIEIKLDKDSKVKFGEEDDPQLARALEYLRAGR